MVLRAALGLCAGLIVSSTANLAKNPDLFACRDKESAFSLEEFKYQQHPVLNETAASAETHTGGSLFLTANSKYYLMPNLAFTLALTSSALVPV